VSNSVDIPHPRSGDARRHRILMMQSTQHRFASTATPSPSRWLGFRFPDRRQYVRRIRDSRTQAAVRSTAIVMFYPKMSGCAPSRPDLIIRHPQVYYCRGEQDKVCKGNPGALCQQEGRVVKFECKAAHGSSFCGAPGEREAHDLPLMNDR